MSNVPKAARSYVRGSWKFHHQRHRLFLNIQICCKRQSKIGAGDQEESPGVQTTRKEGARSGTLNVQDDEAVRHLLKKVKKEEPGM